MSNALMSRVLFALLLLFAATQPVWALNDDPTELVRQTSEQVLQEVAKNKQELTESPGKIYLLVDDIVLPRFDFTRMSRLVLGKHWKRASTAEQSAFVEQFRELLVRTYATALLNYSGQEIKYLPTRMVDGASDVMVNTEVQEAGGPKIPINYRLYRTEDGWKVYDVLIDGVSLVSNYRSSFASQVRRYKLKGLIAKLEARNNRDK